MVYSMSGFIKDTMILQNLLMILMEICLILEFILLFSRIMRSAGKWKIAVSSVWLFASYLFMVSLRGNYF